MKTHFKFFVWKLSLVLYFLSVFTSSESLTSESAVKLHFCSNNSRKDGNQEDLMVSIPEWLQAPLTKLKMEYFESRKDLYPLGLLNFSADFQNVSCWDSSYLATLNFTKDDVYRNDSWSVLEKSAIYSEIFTPNGYFYTNSFGLNPDSYCISKINSEQVNIQACFPPGDNDSSQSEPGTKTEEKDTKSLKKPPTVFKKCCPPGTTMSYLPDYPEYGAFCAENPNADEWTPTLLDGTNSNENSRQAAQSMYKLIENGIASFCWSESGTSVDFFSPFRQGLAPNVADLQFLKDGTVQVRRTGNHAWERPKFHRTNYIEEFCVDGLFDSTNWPSNSASNYLKPTPEMYPVVGFCAGGKAQEEYVVNYAIFYFVIYFPSAILLLIIVIIYGLVWKMQNIHGWTVATFSFSMLVWFTFSILEQAAGIFGYEKAGIPARSTGCVLIAVMSHFFYIATFSWMTILNYDLWSTISSLTPKSARTKGEKQFVLYCLIGFGIPTIIVAISLILENQYGLFDSTIIRPQYGFEVCSLSKISKPYYAIIPNFLLFVVNIIFAGLTLKFLWDYNRNAMHLDKSSTTSNKQQAQLFGKLFTLMGFTWLFELIPNLLEKDDVTWYWAFFQVYNVFQAFGLFWIFVLKKEIRDQLSQKYKVCEKGFSYMDTKLKIIKRDGVTATTSAALSESQP